MATQKPPFLKMRCIHCEAEFEGRRNRKFCSRECRDRHNNDLYKIRHADHLEQERRRVNNRRSLEKIHLVVGDQTFPKSMLDRTGFDGSVASLVRGRALWFGEIGIAIFRENEFVIVTKNEL